jgi:hypothetical protein
MFIGEQNNRHYNYTCCLLKNKEITYFDETPYVL